MVNSSRLKQYLLGGASLLLGIPFLLAGFSSLLLTGKLNKGLPITVVLIVLTWFLTGFQGAVLLAICSSVTAIALRMKKSLLFTLLFCAGLALVAGTLFSLFTPGFMNIGNEELQPLKEVYTSAGLASSEIDQIFSIIVYYSPGIGAIHIVLGVIVSILFFNSISKAKFTGSMYFRMHWAIAWIPILCIFTLIYAKNNLLPYSFLRFTKNLLLFMALPYGIEGFQVALRWAKSIRGMVFILIMSSIFVPPFILSGLILLGILDTWFDYRKIINKKIEGIKNEGSSDQNS